jgi:hypothetical protein
MKEGIGIGVLQELEIGKDQIVTLHIISSNLTTAQIQQ